MPDRDTEYCAFIEFAERKREKERKKKGVEEKLEGKHRAGMGELKSGLSRFLETGNKTESRNKESSITLAA
ncbi:hypothetical protein Baya_1135 [Bagarius yarrelli]|uniref:Uncharacterized protein n=1 Tax=Bagarius yarrelli TaxID=175774 RepID=A0A556TK89_BAGYA|nr:hypothetical protein Baya_1135 [Bagarius yarrelli]